MSALDILTFLVWLLASVTFILALKFLASPRTARTGNLLGAAGMALVVAWTFFTTEGMLANWWVVVVGGVSLTGSIVAFGKLQGLIAARPVKYPGSQAATIGLFALLIGLGVWIAAVDASIPLFLLFVVLALM